MGQPTGTRPPETLSVQEVAARLGLHHRTLYDAIRRGEFPSLRVGRRVLIPRATLERMLDGGAERPAAAGTLRPVPTPDSDPQGPNAAWNAARPAPK